MLPFVVDLPAGLHAKATVLLPCRTAFVLQGLLVVHDAGVVRRPLGNVAVALLLRHPTLILLALVLLVGLAILVVPVPVVLFSWASCFISCLALSSWSAL